MNSIHNTLQTVGCKLSSIRKFIADKACYIFGRMISLCKTIKNYLIPPYRRPQEETFNEFKKLLSERKVKIVNTNQMDIKSLYQIEKLNPNDPKRGKIQKEIEQLVYDTFKSQNTNDTGSELDEFRNEVDEFFTKIETDDFTAPEQRTIEGFLNIVKSCHGIINLFIGIYSTFMEKTNLLPPDEYRECLGGDGKSIIFSFTNALINNLDLYEELKNKGSISPDDLNTIGKCRDYTNMLAYRIHTNKMGPKYFHHSPDWNYFYQRFSILSCDKDSQEKPIDDVNSEDLRSLSSFNLEASLNQTSTIEKIKDKIESNSNNKYHYNTLLRHLNNLSSSFAFLPNLNDFHCAHT